MLFAVFTFVLLMIIAIVLLKAGAVNRLTRTSPASFIIIPAVSGDELFERRVKAFHAEQMFCDGCYVSRILLLIVDENAAAAAFGLADELDGVTALRLDELEEYFTDKYKGYEITDR